MTEWGKDGYGVSTEHFAGDSLSRYDDIERVRSIGESYLRDSRGTTANRIESPLDGLVVLKYTYKGSL